jgi:hypothetical protein
MEKRKQTFRLKERLELSTVQVTLWHHVSTTATIVHVPKEKILT